MVSSTTAESPSSVRLFSSAVESLQKNYNNSLTGNDPYYFLLFAKDLRAVLNQLIADTFVDDVSFSEETFFELYLEIDHILSLYEQTAFAFRYHATYVISTDNFETVQITCSDVRRWYHSFGTLLSMLLKNEGNTS
jgi:hypothetical protein